MGKGNLMTALVLITGVVFVGAVWGQNNSPPGSFSGTVTKVDLANKKLVVQNSDGEMTFQWNNETQIKWSPVEKVRSDSKNLKEGMDVTVSFTEGAGNRVANRIDVKSSNLKTLKGLSFPFECGVQVC